MQKKRERQRRCNARTPSTVLLAKRRRQCGADFLVGGDSQKNRLKPSSQMKGMEVNTRTVVIVKSEPPLKKLKSALKDPNRISSQSKKAKKVTFMGIPDPTPNNSMVESSDSVARSESFSSKEDISSSKSSEADKKTYQHYIEKKKRSMKKEKKKVQIQNQI